MHRAKEILVPVEMYKSVLKMEERYRGGCRSLFS